MQFLSRRRENAGRLHPQSLRSGSARRESISDRRGSVVPASRGTPFSSGTRASLHRADRLPTSPLRSPAREPLLRIKVKLLSKQFRFYRRSPPSTIPHEIQKTAIQATFIIYPLT